MTVKINSELRAEIQALPHLETITTIGSTYHVVGRYNCDVCAKPATICIRDRGRDLYSRCGCGVDARPSLIVQRHKLNMCKKSPVEVPTAHPQEVPTAHPQVKQQPRNLLEYLMNFKIIEV